MNARESTSNRIQRAPLSAPATAIGHPNIRLLAALLLALFALTLALASRAEAFVYWTNSEGVSSPDEPFATIGRANLDGTGPDQSFIADPDFALGLVGLAVDRERVYWADRFYGRIGRANLDGTGAEPFIADASPPPSFPSGVAVDSAHVFWANYFGTTIGRANLDGTGVDPSFISGASVPSAVAVDSEHIYWANRLSNTIGRANLDGTGADQSFITGASFPTGVAVDDQHVYWTSFGFSGGVGRANLDGSGADQSFITSASFPIGVAVDDQHVYWANRNGNSIGRANLDGTGADQSFITARGPRGVAVDALRSFSFGKVQRNGRKGTARLTVEVPGPGALVLAKTTVKGKREQVGSAGRVQLPIEPRGKARKRLKRKGKAKVEATVAYTPDGSDPNSVANTDTRTLKLVRRR